MKNLKVNRKLLCLLLASGITLSSCGAAYGSEVNTNVMDFNDVMNEVEEETVIDEALDYINVYNVNPLTYKSGLIDADEACIELGELISVKQKLNEMGIKPANKDEDYNMIKEAATWSVEDARSMIRNVYYDDTMNKVDAKRLSYYSAYLDEEFKENGLDVASILLEVSIRGRFLDNYDDNYFNLTKVTVDDNNLVYNNKSYEDGTNSLSLLEKIKEAKENENTSNEEIFSLITESYNASKNIIYNGVELESKKIKVK